MQCHAPPYRLELVCTGLHFGPLGAGWAAHQRTASPGGWPAPLLASDLDHRPQSAEPMRPRSADPLRHRLEVPVDAGMAALGFMSDDANAAPAPALGNTP